MPTSDTELALSDLHARFCQLAALDVRDLPYHHFSREWYEFWRDGRTADDLELVIKLVQKENAKREFRYRTKILPSRIIRDLSWFCEKLCEAKRLQRLAAQRTPKTQVLREWYGMPSEPVENNGRMRHISEIIRMTP